MQTMIGMLEQLAKLSDISDIKNIEKLPIFLTDSDPKVRERAEDRLKELENERAEQIRRTVHRQGTS